MEHTALRTLTRSTALELQTAGNWARCNAGTFNFSDLINSRLRQPFKVVDQVSVEVFSDIDRVLRQRSGAVADGTWIPFSALTRDNTTGTAGATIAAAVDNQAVPTLLPTSGIVSGGATVLSGIRAGSLALPILDDMTFGGALWNGEGAGAVDGQPSFKTLVLTPKTLSVEFVISRRLLLNTSIDLDELIRLELSQRFGAAIDAAAIAGAGGDEPSGLLSRADLDVVGLGFDGAAVTFDNLAEMEARVLRRANGSMAKPAWIIGPSLAQKLRTTPKTTASMIYEDRSILGHPAILSSVTPENLTKGAGTDLSALVFGDMAEIIIAFWGPAGIDMMVDGYTHAKDGRVRIIGRAEVGVGVRRIGAFAAITDAATT